MMKIYTKKGDAGETGLYGGNRVPKDDLRIRSYGTLDELNAVLGLILSVDWPVSAAAASLAKADVCRQTILRLQGELFQLGAELATPRGKSLTTAPIEMLHIERLEQEIDSMETELQPLQTFILPGGAASAAWVHLARTVSRRAERELVSLNRGEPLRPAILQYLNRLSDYFFVLARYLNHLAEVKDVPWVAPKKPTE